MLRSELCNTTVSRVRSPLASRYERVTLLNRSANEELRMNDMQSVPT